MAQFNFINQFSKQSDCLNIDANLIIMNKEFFMNQFQKSIRIMIIEITVRGIDFDKHRTKEYVISLIFFRETDENGHQVKTCIKKKIHLIKRLKVNVLIEINVFIFERFVFDFKKRIATIKNCEIIVFIIIKRHSKAMNKIICLKKIVIISSHSQLRVRIHHFDFSQNREFLFESKKMNFDLYAHVIEIETSDILIRNDENKIIKVLRNCRLKRITEVEYSNVYQITNEVMKLAIKRFHQSHQKNYFQKLFRACLSVFKKIDIVFII